MKTLRFIINGTETEVSIAPTATFGDAADLARRQSGNTGRPMTDFQLFIEDNRIAYATPVGETAEGTIVFMSLKAGVGA